MKSLALIGTLTIIILGSSQAQFHKQHITFPSQINILERDSLNLPKTSLTKENEDPFPISETEMMEYQRINYSSYSENSAATSMEWALAKSDASKKLF